MASYESLGDARAAVWSLRDQGFASHDVGLLTPGDDDPATAFDAGGAAWVSDALGVRVGASRVRDWTTGGGIVGASLAAAGLLLLPGGALVFGAATLGLIAGAAAAGAAVGDLAGTFTGLKLDAHQERFFRDEFASGRTIVAVRTGRRAGVRDVTACSVLTRHAGQLATPAPTPAAFRQACQTACDTASTAVSSTGGTSTGVSRD